MPSLLFVNLLEQELLIVDRLDAIFQFDVFYVNDLKVVKTVGTHKF